MSQIGVSASASRQYRYPGASPYRDFELDRKLYFGRTEERDQVLRLVATERLVVVFGRSGLGKTSLVNAGLAAGFRGRKLLPIPVPVDSSPRPLVEAVYESVWETVKSEGIVHYEGERKLLWQYFKTATFSRRDGTTLTPLVILDNFEDFFVRRDAEERADFAEELADLVRGRVPRPLQGVVMNNGTLSYSEHPPAVRVLVCIREEAIGRLQQLATKIPGVFGNRFRLVPLGPEQARRCIEEPAAIEDEHLLVRPFRYDPGAVDEMVSFLGAAESDDGTTAGIDPSQLQLLCTHIERHVALPRQNDGSDTVVIRPEDLGGQEGMRQVLQGFYRAQLAAIADIRERRKARRLVEHGLLSANDRRIWLQKEVIDDEYKLSPDTLGRLLDSHLLREERHGERRTHYSLSHDSLIKPIRASQAARKSRVRNGIVATVAILAVTVGVVVGTALSSRRAANRANLLINDGREAVSQGRSLAALHLFGSALETAPTAFARHRILDEAASLLPRIRLEHILVHSEANGVRGGSLVALFSENGDIVTFDRQTVRVWDASTGAPRPGAGADWGSVSGVYPNASGRHIAVAHRNERTVTVRDLAAGREIFATGSHDYPVHGALLDFDVDSARNLLITWSDDRPQDPGPLSNGSAVDGVIRVYHIGTTEPIESLRYNSRLDGAVLVGRLVVCWYADTTIQLWDVESTRVLAEAEHGDRIRGIALSPSGDRLLVWTRSTAHLLRVLGDGFEQLATLPHYGAVLGARFDKAGSTVLTVGEDNVVRLWDAATGAAVRRFAYPGQARTAQFAADGRYVIVVGGREAMVWETETGVSVPLPLRHDSRIIDAETRGDRILTYSDDRTARVWHMAADRPGAGTATRAARDWRAVLDTRIAPELDMVLLSYWDRIEHLDLDTGEINTAELRGIQACYSDDGTHLLYWGADDSAYLRATRAADETAAAPIDLGGSRIVSAAATRDGFAVVAASEPDGVAVYRIDEDGRVAVRRLGGWKELGEGDSPRGALSRGARSAILWVDSSKTARLMLLDRRSAGGDRVVSTRGGAIIDAVPSPDGRAALLWTTDGLEIVTASGVSQGIEGTHAVLDPAGRWIASLNRGENTVRIYDLRGRLVSVFRHPEVDGATFRADGERLVTWGSDAVVRIWNTDQRRLIAAFPDLVEVFGAAFSSDGKRLACVTRAGEFHRLVRPGPRDMSASLFALQIEALTGTRLSDEGDSVETLSPDVFDDLVDTYRSLAADHYRESNYRDQCPFQWFFPEEAAEIHGDYGHDG